MAGQHAKKWDKVLNKPGKTKPMDVYLTSQDEPAIPKFNDAATFLDERTIGSLSEVQAKDLPTINSTSDQSWRWIKKHGWSENPITKLPRVVGVILKLEELALKGDLEAIKLFMDRVLGKQPELLGVGLTQFQDLSDEELVARMKKQTMSNVVESYIHHEMAVNSPSSADGEKNIEL